MNTQKAIDPPHRDRNQKARSTAAAIVTRLRHSNADNNDMTMALGMFFAYQWPLPSSDVDNLDVRDLEIYMLPVVSAVGEHLIVDGKKIMLHAVKCYRNRFSLVHRPVTAIMNMSKMKGMNPKVAILVAELLQE